MGWMAGEWLWERISVACMAGRRMYQGFQRDVQSRKCQINYRLRLKQREFQAKRAIHFVKLLYHLF